MNYKKLMGYNNSSKKSKIKVNKVLNSIKEEFGYKQGIIKEGPSYEYANYIKKIEKAEKQHRKEVYNLVKLLKKKGLKKEAIQLESNYDINVKRDFMKFLDFLYGKIS